MFETGTETGEYGRYGGRRRRRRRRWLEDDDSETGLYASEAEYGDGEMEGGYGYGPSEMEEEAAYGYGPGEMEGEFGYGPGEMEEEAAYGYGPGEMEGEFGYGSGEMEGEFAYGPGEMEEEAAYGYGPGEMEGEFGYGPGEMEEEAGYGYGPGEMEGEYGESEYGEGEEQFLPLIPIAGKVLGGLLGGLLSSPRKRQSEAMYEGEYGDSEFDEAEAGEAEEQFLHKILGAVLGQEAEFAGAAMPPAQEAQLAAQMLEVSDEAELDEFLSRVVNTIGRAVQGISGAANSPQGRALIEAVKPLARAALPVVGGPVGAAASTVLEMETYGMNEEEQQFEAARRVVRLTSAAAQDVATAPPGAPPQVVSELGLIRAARHVARPLFRSALRAISPLARRHYGSRYRGPRPFVGYRGPVGYRRPVGYGRYRYGGGGWGGRRRYPIGHRPVGYRPWVGGAPGPDEPPQEPMEPPPPPPQPGFRWVAVPIGAPPPIAAPPPGGEPPPGPEGPPPPGGAPATQSEFGRYGRGRGRGGGRGGPSGRWVRRAGKIILLDV